MFARLEDMGFFSPCFRYFRFRTFRPKRKQKTYKAHSFIFVFETVKTFEGDLCGTKQLVAESGNLLELKAYDGNMS